jgi:hypothetical protein
MKNIKLMSKRKSLLLIILISLFSLSISGCSLFQKRYEKTDKKEFQLSASGKTKLVIDNKNGDISIKRNSSDSSVLVIAEITSYLTKKELSENVNSLDLLIDSSSSEIRISTKTSISERNFFNFGNRKNNSINYTVYLPPKIEAELSMVNGRFEASNVSNDLKGGTVNGNISLDKTSGLLKLETVNGKITAVLDSTKGLNFETVNGSVSLKLSTIFSGKFDLDWVNGSVKYDDFNFQNVYKEKRSFKANLGNSDSEIKVSTVNGSIKIQKQ